MEDLTLSEVRAINKPNRIIIKEINDKLGSDWKLTYITEKQYSVNGRYFGLKIEFCKYTRGMTFFLKSENLKLDREIIHDHFYLMVQFGSNDLVWNSLNDQYEKIYEIEKLNEQLQSELSNKTDKPITRKTKI
jgi:hypothetical protein